MLPFWNVHISDTRQFCNSTSSFLCSQVSSSKKRGPSDESAKKEGPSDESSKKQGPSDDSSKKQGPSDDEKQRTVQQMLFERKQLDERQRQLAEALQQMGVAEPTTRAQSPSPKRSSSSSDSKV